MKASWIINRLALMGPGEVFWRLGRKQAHRRLGRTYQDLAGPEAVDRFVAGLGFGSPAKLAERAYDHLTTRMWLFDEAEAAREYQRRFDASALRDEASKIVLEGPSVFGLPGVGREIDWHRDPKTGRSWPREFCHRIDHHDPSVGGIVFTWELNRHQHLHVLAAASLVTGDEKFARVGQEHIASWLDQNPPFVGVNWLSPLEMALRAGAWLWFLRLTAGRSRVEPGLLAKILYSLKLHMDAVAEDRSRYSSANNHLLGEAWGLFLVGVVCPYLPGAEGWRRRGESILAAEFSRQIAPDGVGREQTNRYLAFDFDLLLSAFLLAKDNRMAIHPQLTDRLAATADFFRHQMNQTGWVPDIGDNAEARVFGLSDASEKFYGEVLTSAALLLNRPEFKAGQKMDRKNFFLFGPGAPARFQALPRSLRPARSRLFAEGGYGVLRRTGGGDMVAVVDVGPLGYLSLCAHGHADALSLTLSIAGQPVLIDPGTYLYHSGGAWRDYFRSTAAHNTVVIDGQDQSRPGGPFMWLTKAQVEVESFERSEDRVYLAARHTGYERRGIGVVHRREVILDRKAPLLTITDTLTGPGDHRLEIMFHFPPGLTPVLQGRQYLIDGLEATVLMELDPQTTGRVVTGQNDPPRGWFSDRFGQKTAAVTLIGEAAFQDRLTITTTITCLSSPAQTDNIDGL
jgi:hypothetical protein